MGLFAGNHILVLIPVLALLGLFLPIGLRARRALEASERRYRMLFENNPHPMWIFDEETLAFLDVNASAVECYGYTRQEFLAMTLTDIRPPEEVPDLLEDIRRQRNIRHSDGPWRHRKRDGSIIAVEITAVPISGLRRPAKFVLATDVTARVEAEAALRRSEEQHRVIVETASDAIVTINEESTILFASAPVERIFGYRPGELVGQSLLMLIPEPLRSAHLRGFERYLATNQRHTSWQLLELPGLHRNGSEVPLELSFGEFRSGSRRWFTGVIRDVSERRRAEESLSESRNLIQTVFNTVPLAIWGIDLLGRVTFWNHAAEAVFGWTEQEVLGQDLPIIPEEQHQEYQQWLSGYALGLPHTGVERQRKRKAGTLIDCEIWTAPLRSAAGAITGTVGILADITERKRYESALVEDELKFRKLFADNPQPMWVFDENTLRFLEVNDAAVRHYGYSREEFFAMTLGDLRAAADRPTLLGPQSISESRELKHVLKDGRIVTVHVAAHRVQLFGTSAILSLLQDVTDRKHVEGEIAKHVRNLARSNADLQQFAWAASHDLLEPIRMVTLHTQLFERQFGGIVPEQGRQYLEYAREGAFRMKALVDALRDYWDIQHRPLQIKTISLASVIQSAQAALTLGADATPVAVTCDDLPSIEADEALLNRLMLELFQNAAKFRSDAPPRVHVSAARSAGYWTVLVEDNGIGIEPAYLESVFRIFYRLSREHPGVGIGLSLCKQILERHNGRISIASRPGVGTTVQLQFPCETG